MGFGGRVFTAGFGGKPPERGECEEVVDGGLHPGVEGVEPVLITTGQRIERAIECLLRVVFAGKIRMDVIVVWVIHAFSRWSVDRCWRCVRSLAKARYCALLTASGCMFNRPAISAPVSPCSRSSTISRWLGRNCPSAA